MVTKDTLFRPSKAESKADTITKIAMGIIDSETAARESKTARLRAARAERDASEATRIASGVKKTPKKKSAKAKPAN
ncbi:hypothetical protein [Palleronia sp.]|uniref:hypothetical protein n=1 Tax=Palleronia sp. TaxID=1940284 RepID=UPI0035C85FE1